MSLFSKDSESSTNPCSSNSSTQPSQRESSATLTNTNNDYEKTISDNERKIIISQLVSKSDKNIFEKVIYKFGQKSRSYTPIYNWFISKHSFETTQKSFKISFKCIVCGNIYPALMGKPGNLKAHLKTHSESKKWIDNFEKFQNKE